MSKHLPSFTNLAPNVRCARCGAAFACGYTAGAAQCWCMHVEGEALPVPDVGDANTCLCPACLHLTQAQRTSGFLDV